MKLKIEKVIKNLNISNVCIKKKHFVALNSILYTAICRYII